MLQGQKSSFPVCEEQSRVNNSGRVIPPTKSHVSDPALGVLLTASLLRHEAGENEMAGFWGWVSTTYTGRQEGFTL